jgi:peptide/nickel transport system permease protein
MDAPGMISFVARRILSMLPVLAFVAILVFWGVRLAPGDPAAAIVGDSGRSADIASVRAELGLDRPLLFQFGQWIGRIARGDLGRSYYMQQPVASLIAERLEPTISLASVTLLFAIFVGVPIGVVAASRHGGFLDRVLMSASVLGFSVPVFLLGYVLIWVVALHWGLLPVQGYARLHEGHGLWSWLRHLILPALALSVVYIALIARVTRAAVAEAMTEDFIKTARAKGITEMRVVWRHAAASSAVPIVTVIGIGVALLIGGVVVTETVFAIPGLGQLTVDAALARDYPVIQAITLLFSFLYVVINMIVDISYIFLDPRIEY